MTAIAINTIKGVQKVIKRKQVVKGTEDDVALPGDTFSAKDEARLIELGAAEPANKVAPGNKAGKAKAAAKKPADEEDLGLD